MEGDSRVRGIGGYLNVIICIASNQTDCSILRVSSKYVVSLKPNLKKKRSYNRDGP